MKKPLSLLIAAAAAVSLYSCQSGSKTGATAKDPLDLSGRDTTVSPAENFFLYANGTWLKNTVIPASKSGWGSFYVVRDQALQNMKDILDSCAKLKDAKKGSVAQQIGDLYMAALDSAAIEKAGISPLQDNLNRIDSLKTVQELLNYITGQYTKGNGALFSFYVSPDDKNSNVERPHFDQGGLGLPNCTYYTKTDGKSKEILDKYHQYVAQILKLTFGDKIDADKAATDIINLETQLAKASKTPVQLRDPEANYHLLTAAGMNKIAPGFDWTSLLKDLKVNEDTILVGQPEFYKAVSGLLKNTPIDTWQKYLAFHLVSGYASWLSKPFADAHFGFYDKTLNGLQQPEERWKRASSLVNGTLGDALGQLYVQKYFPPEAKQYMENLVANIEKAYAEKIKDAEWMSDATKEKALDKLHAITRKIGYPDKWKDYSSIDISKTTLVADLQHIGEWQYNDDINKLGKPVDKTEWQMTPPTVNAYYNPSFNEIVFPAGILQPPFYFQHGDDAVNYGGIGYVIGHEITHGFDDQGSQYDKEGNLKNWWTPEDRKQYETRANKIVDQYNNYVVLDSVHVNGHLTEGENLADNGGLAIAYAAFKMTKEGQSDTLIDGLTPDQRFFLSCAQVWRIKTRPERMLFRINNDPHSPEMYRVNGPLSNMSAFYKAFNVKPGDKMYRPDSGAKIW
ncbi:MAG TPA: M13 family metallopeptidase [Edaphocola sp.]|nr:M13 family metallopeptidase [Edaphocola sp.]